MRRCPRRFASRVMTLQTKAVVNGSKDPGVIIRKHERRSGSSRAAGDTFAGKAPVNYGEMGEVERQELRQQVATFLDGDMPVDDLPCESLKQVREIFRILKHSYRGAKTELEDALAKGPAPVEAPADAPADAEGEEPPTEPEPAADEEEGDAEGEVGDMDAEGSTFNVGVAPPTSYRRRRPPPTAPLASRTPRTRRRCAWVQGQDAKAKRRRTR